MQATQQGEQQVGSFIRNIEEPKLAPLATTYTSKLLILQFLLLFLSTVSLKKAECFNQLHDNRLRRIHEKGDINSATGDEQIYNPVVFIPGVGGSQLEARLNKTTRKHYICSLQSDWFDLWLNIHLLGPVAIDCLLDNMMLYYNKTTGDTYNSEGVDIRATNFGSLESVDYLDIYKIPYTGYFENIIGTIEKQNGLIRDVGLRGAAYDFRKAPNELEEFFIKLESLIEETYVMNNYRPVTLICHSMGCLNSLYLLNRKSPDWKEVFVRRLITLAAPWDGSFKAISAMFFGDNLGIPLISKEKLQALQSTFPSLMYVFPRSPTFESNQTLVETPTKNYTLENLDELFKVTGRHDQMDMWHTTSRIAANLEAPEVELWCMYGRGSKTPSRIKFEGAFEKGSYTEIESEGDGTVNLESLSACERFGSQQSKPVYTRMFENTDHIGILRSDEPAQFISRVILKGDLPSTLDNEL